MSDDTTKTLTTQDTDNISASNLTANGYCNFNNGLVLAWAYGYISTTLTVISKPTPFKTLKAYITDWAIGENPSLTKEELAWCSDHTTNTTDSFKSTNNSNAAIIWWIGTEV